MSNGKYITADMVSNMRTMQEQGMSHKEIAASIGVSPNTVWRYLGKQNGRHVQRRAEPQHRQEESQPEPSLVVQNKNIELHGRFGVYNVDCKKANVLVSLPKTESEEELFNIEFDKLGDLICELQAIQRKIADKTAWQGNEMW